MSDLARWKIHGPVATLRTENAEWDNDRGAWKPASFFTVTSFRPDGAMSTSDAHNPGGSISHSRWIYDTSCRLTESDSWMNSGVAQRVFYFYDGAGRHIRTAQLRADGSEVDLETCSYDAEGNETKRRLMPTADKEQAGTGAVSLGYSIESTDMMLGAPGATTMSTTYIGASQPAKVILEDANGKPLREVHFTRDVSGRLLTVEIRLGGESPFKEMAEHVSADQREAMAAALGQIFGNVFSRTTFAYDSQGRLVEQTNNMGTMSEEHTTYRYDNHLDEPVEEIAERRSREATVDNGTVLYKHDTVSTQHTRFEYRYDSHENWTERIISIQSDPNADFQLSNVERRTITYYS